MLSTLIELYTVQPSEYSHDYIIISKFLNFPSIFPGELFISFSLCKNTKALFNITPNPNDISIIHGIRFINAALLLISHKSMALFFNPHMNRTKMIEVWKEYSHTKETDNWFDIYIWLFKDIGEYVSVVARAAAIYTDAFIMLSGLLTSYAIIGRLRNKQSPRILHEYVSRYLRIVPALAALVLFCTFVLPELGSGPQWNLVVNEHAAICKKNWWRNFLFIHNYFGFSEMVRIPISVSHFILLEFELIPYLIIVFNAYSSFGDWHTIVHLISHFNPHFVEMAKIWFSWIGWIGNIQHCSQILCDNCPSVIKLCLFRCIVSSKNQRIFERLKDWKVSILEFNNCSEQPIWCTVCRFIGLPFIFSEYLWAMPCECIKMWS